MNDIIFFTSYCNSKEKIDVLSDNIEYVKNNYKDKKIGIHANYPLPINIQKNVDHYIFEDLNFNYKKNNINFFYWELPFFEKRFVSYVSNLNYGLSSLRQIRNISYYFQNYDRIIICNYDIEFNDDINFDLMDKDLNLYKFEKNAYSLVLISFNPKPFYDKISKHFNKEKYMSFKDGAEQFFYKIVNESDIDKKYIDYKPNDKIGGFRDIFITDNPYFKNKFLSFDKEPNLYLWGTDMHIKNIEIEINNNKRIKLLNNKNASFFHSEINCEPKEFEYLKVIKIDDINTNIELIKYIDENFIENNKTTNKK